MTNVRTNLASFGAFLSPPAPFPRDSRTTIHSPFATCFTSHVARPTIVGVRRRCRAPSWVLHSPPGRRQYATQCYFSGFRQKFGELGFRRNLTWKWDLRPFLSRLSSDATLDLITYLKRSYAVMSPRSRFPKKPPFRAHFRAFYPHPAHKSSLRAEWATHFLVPGKRGWSPTPMTNLGGLCLELLSGKGLESAFLEEIGLKHETVLCHHGAVFPKTPMKTRTVPWLHRLRLPPRGHLPNGHNGEPSVLSRSRVRCVSFSPRKSGNKSNKSPASTVAGKGFAGHCNPSL